jgi:hypothetical protein
MTPQQLLRQALDHIIKPKRALLLRHAGVKYHLQQQIAELLAQIGEISALDCVDNLVGFLDRIRGDAREILLQIPWAARHGGAQGRHDLQEA